MNKLLSCALATTLILSIPSLAMAKKTKGIAVSGKVTAVNSTSITIKEGKKQGGQIDTINVPTGTPIKRKDGSAAPALSELVGKHVKVKESAPGIAKEIIVGKHKKKKAATTA